MEIETKIFEVKKIRKILKKEGIEPYRVSDIVDYFFDPLDFKAHKIWVEHATKSHSGSISFKKTIVEIPDPLSLERLEKFLLTHKNDQIKIRIRVADSIPFVTFKWPKKVSSGVKSRDEIEARIGSLSDMMLLLLRAGAKLTKAVTRIREIYRLPKFPDSELVIDTYHFAHDVLEYAEVESPTQQELHRIAEEFLDLSPKSFSDTGITTLHGEQEEKTISDRLSLLENMLESEQD